VQSAVGDARELSSAAVRKVSDVAPKRRSNALTASLDADLRCEVEAVMGEFTDAFKAALDAPHQSELERLRRAASELARAGARTQIVVERFAGSKLRALTPSDPMAEEKSDIDDAVEAGTVRFFNSDKSFGFVTMDNAGPDVFVSGGALKRAGIPALRIGQRVRLTMRSGPRGPMAERVELMV
jgi:CspA family cold shock protein